MGSKTRYLQLSDVIMMEYTLNSKLPSGTLSDSKTFLKLKFKDNHYGIISPSSYEIRYDTATRQTVKLDDSDLKSLATIHHLAIPTDSTDSFWFTFMDESYKTRYCYDIDGVDSHNTIKFIEYTNRLASSQIASASFTDIQYDSLKLYFVNGYDFDNIFGIVGRIYVENLDGGYLDLCDIFIDKASAYNMMTYMSTPIIFGDNIYDRYIEFNIPAFNDIKGRNNDTFFNVYDNATLRLTFSYIEKDSYTLEDLSRSTRNIMHITSAENVCCSFTRGSTVKGAVPVENIASDNLGIFIAENPNYPYFEFYGTWKNKPLDTITVQGFNRDILLYNPSAVYNQESGYVVDEDYTPAYNYKKWVAMHEIECNIMDASGNVIKAETYQMSQVFIYPDETETKRFYYRPVYFDTKLSDDDTKVPVIMSINYTMRFMNVDDRVQFIKKGSISSTNFSKFNGKSFNMPIENVAPLKVYNKSVQSVQSVGGGINPIQIKKYVNVFYDSATIVLQDTGGELVANYQYVLQLSEVPKNYKFIFKKTDSVGKSSFLDLSDGYYKLYFKDNGGNETVISPTYSDNMNLVYGELEFSLSATNLYKLMNVDETARKMSIVSVGDNGNISSMYDLKYKF